LAALILFTIGVVCIVFPSQCTKVIQKVLSHVADVQSNYMKTSAVPEEDRVIRPVFSIVIGFVILALALLAYSQSK